MKNGFIQIPIIIAILIGTTIVGGVSYVGVQQYQKKEESKTFAQTELKTQEGNEIKKLREELELLRAQRENQEKPEPQIIEKIIKKPVMVQQSAPLPNPSVLGETSTETARVQKDFQIASVSVTHLQNLLRIEWETSEPSQSKIFIWPSPEISGHIFLSSPSSLSEHYANISYDNFPLYSNGNNLTGDYLRYNYRIEAKNKDHIITEKTGEFTLSEHIDASSIDHDTAKEITISHPYKSCNALLSNDYFLEKIHFILCKNYRSYHGLPDPAAPPAPGFPQASAVSSSQINLSWNSVEEATSYVIEKKINNIWTIIFSTSNTQYSDTNLYADTTYDYRIRSKNVSGISEGYASIFATTQPLPPPPPPPCRGCAQA